MLKVPVTFTSAQSITLTNGFRLYVCARTSDQANDADKVYVSEASADWSFDGRGKVDQNFNWLGPGAVAPPPNGWVSAQGGNPTTTGIKADVLAAKGTFN
jgi:hypothetical protein